MMMLTGGLQADYALALGGLDCSDEAELDEASFVAASHEGHHERAAERREAGAREACAPWKAAALRLVGLCEQPRRRLQACHATQSQSMPAPGGRVGTSGRRYRGGACEQAEAPRSDCGLREEAITAGQNCAMSLVQSAVRMPCSPKSRARPT